MRYAAILCLNDDARSQAGYRQLMVVQRQGTEASCLGKDSPTHMASDIVLELNLLNLPTDESDKKK